MEVWSDTRVPNAAGGLDRAFSAVGEQFVENFEADAEIGASFAAYIDGELVANIRGGFIDRKKETAWSEDTLCCIYSTSKAVLALLVAHEVSNGALDYEAPVAAYWPEFAQNGKEAITLGELMSHQAGLSAIADEMSPEEWIDWEAITTRLAALKPLWKPGTANGYSPQTFGIYVGEILRRVTGKTVGGMLREFHDRFGTEVYCGLQDAEMARAAFMTKPPQAPDLGEITELKRIAFLKRWSATSRVSREEWMAAEIPSSNIHADARSLALLLQPMANGGVWPDGSVYLTPAAIDAMYRERIRGADLTLPYEFSWSAGVMRNINGHFGPSRHAYGHAGFGGSCVVIDPENNLTAAYIMNRMSPHIVGDPRAIGLFNALYEGL